MMMLQKSPAREISRHLPVLGALLGTVGITVFFCGLFSYDPTISAPEERTSGEVLLLLPENQKAAEDLQRWFAVHDPSVIARSQGSASKDLPLPEHGEAVVSAVSDPVTMPEIAAVPAGEFSAIPRKELPMREMPSESNVVRAKPRPVRYPRILLDHIAADWKVPSVTVPKGCQRFAVDFSADENAGDLRYWIAVSTGDSKVDLQLIRALWSAVQTHALPVRMEIEWEQTK